ncbi:MAG: sugar transferase [Archangiaceae bacterium]|nr:sugar transferase [Archangiaceae bacterium]
MLAAGFGHSEIIVLSGVAMWLMLGITLRHYDAWAYGRTAAFDTGMVSIMMMAVMTLLIVLARLVPGAPQLAEVAVVPLACWPLLIALRLLVFRTISRQEAPLDEVLIIGTGSLARKTAEDIRARGKRRVSGHLAFQGDAALPGQLGVAADLDKILRTTPVDEVMIAGSPLKVGPEMQACIRVCERLGVPFALPLSGFRFDRARPVGGRAVSDGYLHYLSVDLKRHQRAVKRLFDIAASSFALVVLSPLLLAVAAIIKLTSKGPVFFKQTRCGLHGRPFQMLKFRSMVVDAEQLREKLMQQNEMKGGPVFKMKNDPRITPIGRFIRKFSIDELPQLINVLAGDMSVVGPRPALPKEVEVYESWQRRRLSVRPGLTCIWQVSGRNQISFEEWMVLDMQYIDRWSLGFDISLILKTFPVVLTGRGAS